MVIALLLRLLYYYLSTTIATTTTNHFHARYALEFLQQIIHCLSIFIGSSGR